MVGTMSKMKRDIAIMAVVVAAMVVIRNHEMGKEDPIARKKRGEI